MNVIDLKDFPKLFSSLQSHGYTVIGPAIRNGAVVYEPLESVAELPAGWTDLQAPASYELVQGSENTLFGYTAGAISWKRYFYPLRTKLFTAQRDGKTFKPSTDAPVDSKLALLGVRPCELHAIRIHDRIFLEGPYADPAYRMARELALVIVVNCVRAGGTCFCSSMNTGPRAHEGFDIALTEIFGDGYHYFVAETETGRGGQILDDVPHRPAGQEDLDRVDSAIEKAAAEMGRTLNTDRMREILNENFDHPQWDGIAKRCLTCANCTMVCPTCFCSTVEDVTDLTGTKAERWRRWDSCFTMDFTRVAGGIARASAKSRYRQWLMHKLSYWIDQFGTPGCVGCGRCITWCPVGIDLTAEMEAFRRNESPTTAPASGQPQAR